MEAASAHFDDVLIMEGCEFGGSCWGVVLLLVLKGLEGVLTTLSILIKSKWIDFRIIYKYKIGDKYVIIDLKFDLYYYLLWPNYEIGQPRVSWIECLKVHRLPEATTARECPSDPTYHPSSNPNQRAHPLDSENNQKRLELKYLIWLQIYLLVFEIFSHKL